MTADRPRDLMEPPENTLPWTVIWPLAIGIGYAIVVIVLTLLVHIML